MPTQLTNAQLADKLSNVADGWQVFVDQFRDWLAGTVNGGPNSDGFYPVTNGLGVTYTLPALARLVGLTEKGNDGTSVLNGTTAPGSGLGNDGDVYINTVNYNLYRKAAGAWVLVANMVGPQGLSAHQVWQNNGFAGQSEAQYLTWLSNAQATAVTTAVNTITAAVATDASNAAASAAAALSSKNAAATSETNAATSATNAATSEANALTSKNAAATSATNAATSAANALTSEQNAGLIAGFNASDYMANATNQTVTGQKTWSTGFIRFSHANQTGVDDGKIGANLLGAGLNLIGVQTVAAGGRVITTAGRMQPLTTGVDDLGSSTLKYRDIYARNLFINDLTISGTTTQVDTTTLTIADPVIELARGNATAVAPYIGMKAGRGGTDSFFVFDEGIDTWCAYLSTNDLSTRSDAPIKGSIFTSTVTTGTAPFTVASQTLVANLNAALFQGLGTSAFVLQSGKANLTLAEAGVDDTTWMTPATTKAAIIAQQQDLLTQFSQSVTATGSSQMVTLPYDLALDELLVFENGVEQDSTDIVKSGTAQYTFTRTAGSKIRFAPVGGMAGKSFDADARGVLAGRSTYDASPVGFCYLATDTGAFYFRSGANGNWLGPFNITGPQGPAGTNGTNASYSSTAPLALGPAAAAGTANAAAREDHVHQFPLATISQTLTAAGSLAASDHGKVVEWNAASAALTLPANLAVGFNCIVRVIHATGIPTFTAASGATLRQADSYTKARKQWSEVSVSVRANAGGSAAEYVLSGDMSA